MWPKDGAALPAGGLTDVIREAIARSGALHEAAKAAEALKEQQAREEQEMKGQVHATFSVISLARVRARALSLSLSPVCFFLSFFCFLCVSQALVAGGAGHSPLMPTLHAQVPVTLKISLGNKSGDGSQKDKDSKALETQQRLCVPVPLRCVLK